MKRFFSLVLVVVFLLVLSACGGNNAPGITDSAGSSTNLPEESTHANGGQDTSASISVTSLKSHSENDASDFNCKDVDGGVKITDYLGEDRIVVIPRQIKGKTVVEIESYAFANDCKVRGVLIPDTVKTLSFTFVNNENIEVVVCEGVEELGEGTFLNCKSINTIVLGKSLKTLGKHCVAVCPKLNEIYVSENVTGIDESIAWSVFLDCSNLTIVTENGSYIEQFAKEHSINYKNK